ncbi:unnamed protein product [Fraxinus pennsylvanica]|uniref:Uncharacterized protein n=1 Tax=Fraxinus pennsylvanica TaxID=56036 RepID=A0AAD2E743_9LAMI|nr:unnamed protein product [Fraxinus pennsylvanica]
MDLKGGERSDEGLRQKEPDAKARVDGATTVMNGRLFSASAAGVPPDNAVASSQQLPPVTFDATGKDATVGNYAASAGDAPLMNCLNAGAVLSAKRWCRLDKAFEILLRKRFCVFPSYIGKCWVFIEQVSKPILRILSPTTVVDLTSLLSVDVFEASKPPQPSEPFFALPPPKANVLRPTTPITSFVI